MDHDPESPNQACRSTEEVADALQGLTAEQQKRLWNIAKNRITAAGLDPAVYDPDGLFAAAIEASLREDGKKWKAGVTIEAHLCMAMRNIADHWARRIRPGRLLDQLPEVDSEELDATDAFGHHAENVRDQLDLSALISRIEEALADDPIALGIVTHRLRGLSGIEIRSALSITGREYQAALKRIYRNKKLTQINEQEKESRR